MTPELESKYARLQSNLRDLGRVVIGYSGGVDSTLLLKAAVDVLGDNALAVIGKSATYPTREYEEAVRNALTTAKQGGTELGIVDRIVEIDPSVQQGWACPDGGIGFHLHQADGAGAREGRLFPAALPIGDGEYEVRIQIVMPGGADQDGPRLRGREPGRGRRTMNHPNHRPGALLGGGIGRLAV